MRKQKIGEAKVTLFIDMDKNENLYPNITEQEIKKPSPSVQEVKK